VGVFLDTELEERLWRKRGILLLPLRKDNQKNQRAQGVQKALGHFRHRVETVFSIFTTVFNVGYPRGRTFAGYVARVATCILAHTLCFFLAQAFDFFVFAALFFRRGCFHMPTQLDFYNFQPVSQPNP
jgi:hypothetical protein